MAGRNDSDDGACGVMRSRRGAGRGGRCKVAPWPQVSPRIMLAWVSFVPVMLYGLYLIGAPLN